MACSCWTRPLPQRSAASHQYLSPNQRLVLVFASDTPPSRAPIGYNSAMTISLLGYAILSLLARWPLSGYDIAREMKKPHSFFFGQAQFSQIYPELARLEASKLVTSRIVPQQGKPDR